jgi:hypothetical protein
MLQQLVLESCFLISSRVSFVRAGVALGVADFDGEGLWVALLDGEGLWVALRDGVGVALADGLADALTDALAVALTDGLGDGVPFFQISFVPDLAHTYLTLETVLAVPTLVQLVPAIVAACEGIEIADSNTAVRRTLEYALNFMG